MGELGGGGGWEGFGDFEKKILQVYLHRTRPLLQKRISSTFSRKKRILHEERNMLQKKKIASVTSLSPSN